MTYENQADGVWYFHIRSLGDKGWSDTVHFRIQIDTLPPDTLDIVVDSKDESEKRPMISFNANDSMSGIDYYELRIDDGEWEKVQSPYIPEKITAGKHTVTVRSFDKAGNMKEGSLTIAIKQIVPPIFTKPIENDSYKTLESIYFEGVSEKGTTITIYLDGRELISGILVDENGKWQAKYLGYISSGDHEIFAIAQRDGILSEKSKIIHITIDGSTLVIFGINIPAWGFYSIVGVLIILIITLFFLIFIIFKRRKKKDEKEKNLEQINSYLPEPVISDLSGEEQNPENLINPEQENTTFHRENEALENDEKNEDKLS